MCICETVVYTFVPVTDCVKYIFSFNQVLDFRSAAGGLPVLLKRIPFEQRLLFGITFIQSRPIPSVPLKASTGLYLIKFNLKEFAK